MDFECFTVSINNEVICYIIGITCHSHKHFVIYEMVRVHHPNICVEWKELICMKWFWTHFPYLLLSPSMLDSTVFFIFSVEH